ncbi:MAG: hypothetical protein KME08_21285 [Aphanothece sp. CMT-3BRIN-NPC111]|jgi:hypothetical protein|nr:hypothetical protein [Aphanothece sp. CMT-3BRIN-NPC111]
MSQPRVAKPLGYYVSVSNNHPVYSLLYTLEKQYGSYFQRVCTKDLRALLTYVAAKSDSQSTWGLTLFRDLPELETAITVIGQLPLDLQANLIPFLWEQIATRGE